MRLTPSQSTHCIKALEPFTPAVIYVFGSYGTESQHAGSDLDIAFLPKTPIDAFHVFQIANSLSSDLGIDVDLIDLSKASTVLRKEVIRTGEPIHIHHESIMRQFEMLTLADYARLNEERHEILATR
jgi:predicted nucleotidyltransferase